MGGIRIHVYSCGERERETIYIHTVRERERDNFCIYDITCHSHRLQWRDAMCTRTPYVYTYSLFVHVHPICTCTPYLYMYTLFMNVHPICTRTAYLHTYTLFIHVQPIRKCTPYLYMYTLFMNVQPICTRTPYLYTYSLFIHVHPIRKCTAYLYMYTLFMNVHPICTRTPYLYMYSLFVSVQPIYTCTPYWIWSVIPPISKLNRRSSFLGLFCHVPLKRDQWNWDCRISANDSPNAIGCTKSVQSVSSISGNDIYMPYIQNVFNQWQWHIYAIYTECVESVAMTYICHIYTNLVIYA